MIELDVLKLNNKAWIALESDAATSHAVNGSSPLNDLCTWYGARLDFRGFLLQSMRHKNISDQGVPLSLVNQTVLCHITIGLNSAQLLYWSNISFIKFLNLTHSSNKYNLLTTNVCPHICLLFWSHIWSQVFVLEVSSVVTLKLFSIIAMCAPVSWLSHPMCAFIWLKW